jgi:hypothetical protein
MLYIGTLLSERKYRICDFVGDSLALANGLLKLRQISSYCVVHFRVRQQKLIRKNVYLFPI